METMLPGSRRAVVVLGKWFSPDRLEDREPGRYYAGSTRQYLRREDAPGTDARGRRILADDGATLGREARRLDGQASRWLMAALPRLRPASITDVREAGDLIVTVCDLAHEELDEPTALHWSVPDPVPGGDPGTFDATVTELADRVRSLAPRLAPALLIRGPGGESLRRTVSWLAVLNASSVADRPLRTGPRAVPVRLRGARGRAHHPRIHAGRGDHVG